MPARAPIIVVSGLPRSGTSLMMRMLQAAGIPAFTDSERAPDPDNPHGYFEFEGVKSLRKDTSWLAQAEGKAVKVIHLLLMDLPPDREYLVIFMNRDLDEVITSQRKMLERSGKPGGSLAPESLKAAFRSQVAQVRAWLAVHPGFRVTDVDYNALMRDPVPIASQLAQFLGLAGREGELIAAIDPGLYRNRKP